MSRQEIGARGEAVAADFLARRGMELLAQNLRAPGGEIDLVMRDGDEVVFVEVKTRTSEAFGSAAEAITARKCEKMLVAAEWWFGQQNFENAPEYRIDVVAIDVHGDRCRCEHFKNIEVPD